MLGDETGHALTIGIVGGGFSGTMVAVGLMRQRQDVDLNVVMIERTAQLARGVAYGTRCESHVLNVPAGMMSALPDLPDHFLQWAWDRDRRITAQSFVPRALYGEYLAGLLGRVSRERDARVCIELLSDEAVGVETAADGRALTLRLRSGRELTVDRLVLALGNTLPANPAVADPSFYHSARYVRDPWCGDACTGLGPDEPVLFIGTGLTCVDKVLELRARGHHGPLHALSRHGLLPHAHRLEMLPLPILDLPVGALTMRALCRALRRAVAETSARGGDWRAVMDALRPLTQEIWQALPLEEKRRFLRHVRAYWEVHRHRLAPDVAARLAAQLASGQLQVHAGRLQRFCGGADGVTVVYRPRGGSGVVRTLRVARVINCTGPAPCVATSEDPLLGDLRRQGLIRPDPLGLGLDVDTRGHVLDARGQPSPALFTIGTLRKGRLWETTAVPELRSQAVQLVQTLLGSLPASPPLVTSAAL